MEISIDTNCGVYELRHVSSNVAYCGSSRNLKNRRYKHFYMLAKNCHGNPRLQAAYNSSVGNSEFQFSVLTNCTEDDLITVEQTYLDTEAFGLNVSRSAVGRSAPMGENTRSGLLAANVGKTVSHETRRKMSNAHKGKVRSAETRKKTSGERSNKFRGWFITPFGRFATVQDVENACYGLLSYGSILKACRTSDTVITKHAYACSIYLRTHHDISVIGKRWSDLNFSFEPATKH